MSTRTLVLVAALSLSSGCGTERVVEVNARVTIEATNEHLTMDTALQIFRRVAEQLTLPVEGPIRFGEAKFEYTARRPENPLHLLMIVDSGHVSFLSSTLNRSAQRGAANQAATLFQRALDEKGIPCKITERTGTP